jgi:hypothetical protein
MKEKPMKILIVSPRVPDTFWSFRHALKLEAFFLVAISPFLFDQGCLTVTPELGVEISQRIKEEYENGRDYYRYHGNPLVVLPPSQMDGRTHTFSNGIAKGFSDRDN